MSFFTHLNSRALLLYMGSFSKKAVVTTTIKEERHKGAWNPVGEKKYFKFVRKQKKLGKSNKMTFTFLSLFHTKKKSYEILRNEPLCLDLSLISFVFGWMISYLNRIDMILTKCHFYYQQRLNRFHQFPKPSKIDEENMLEHGTVVIGVILH